MGHTPDSQATRWTHKMTLIHVNGAGNVPPWLHTWPEKQKNATTTFRALPSSRQAGTGPPQPGRRWFEFHAPKHTYKSAMSTLVLPLITTLTRQPRVRTIVATRSVSCFAAVSVSLPDSCIAAVLRSVRTHSFSFVFNVSSMTSRSLTRPASFSICGVATSPRERHGLPNPTATAAHRPTHWATRRARAPCVEVVQRCLQHPWL